MKIEKKFFKNVLVFKIDKYRDKRGSFFETYNETKIKKYFKKKFLYDAISTNKKNVFRGFHYQTKFKQSKLVQVLEGKIIDIVVDIKKKSKTYLQYRKIILSESNNRMIYIPEGYAHGFYVLSKKAIISYKISNKYKKKYEKTIYWNDNRLNFNLFKRKKHKVIFSKKDSEK